MVSFKTRQLVFGNLKKAISNGEGPMGFTGGGGIKNHSQGKEVVEKKIPKQSGRKRVERVLWGPSLNNVRCIHIVSP